MDTPNTPSTEPQADIMSELLRNVDRTVHSQIAQMFTDEVACLASVPIWVICGLMLLLPLCFGFSCLNSRL